MALHLIFNPAGYTACRNYFDKESDKDVLLLIGDGVYAAADGPVYGLAEDFAVRGVQAGERIQLISYAQFVELTVDHHPAISWTG